MKKILILIACLSAFACAPQKREYMPEEIEGAKQVRVLKVEPQAQCKEIHAVVAVDGGGCGSFGSPGTYQGAINDLKVRSFKLGGNVAIIDHIKERGMLGDCFDQSVTISARVLSCSN